MNGMSSDERSSLCGLQVVRETAENALNALYQTQSKIELSRRKSSRVMLHSEVEKATESLEKCYQRITQVQAQMFAENPIATQKIKYVYHWTLSQHNEFETTVAMDDFKSVAVFHQFITDPKPERNYNAFGFLLPHINQGFAAVRAIINAGDNRSHIWTSMRLNQLLVECNKIEVLVDLIPAALATPTNSVASPTQFLLDAVETPTDPESLSRNLATFASRLEKVKCMAKDAIQHSNGLLQQIKLATSGIYYCANPDQARHEANLVGVDPDIRMIKFMWNLTEHAAGRALYKVTFPKIAQHETFYILPSDIEADEQAPNQPPVKVRYLSSKRSDRVVKNIEAIRLRQQPSGCQVFLRSPGCLRFQSTASQEDDFHGQLEPLILHFHGGGFVAQSSYSHQTYSRQWVNGTNVAVLSVDYRLAPESQYPAPIDDAWLVYRWCLQHGPRVLGIDPTRIVVAGDSAGGSIAASLVIKALANGVQPPSGLCMAYPCLCLSADVFYPSSLSCLEEVMIPYGFLLACMKAYVPTNGDPLHDPELSPAVVSDDILKRFPAVKIMVGARDPLLDQSLEFAQRLYLLSKDIQLVIYSGFGHGFLSFDNPVVGVPESHSCVLKSIEWLQQLTRMQ